MSRKNHQWFSLVMMAGLSCCLVVGSPTPAYAMHIMEGFLPVGWAVFWWIVYLPFLFWGLRSLTHITRQHPETKVSVYFQNET